MGLSLRTEGIEVTVTLRTTGSVSSAVPQSLSSPVPQDTADRTWNMSPSEAMWLTDVFLIDFWTTTEFYDTEE